MGNLESTKVYGKINFLTKLNLKFFDQTILMKNLVINDINLLAAKVGIDKWYNDSFYFNFKYVLSHEAIPVLSHSILKIIMSIIGKSKKCLVVDFDNTLWGGIVGEVGPDDIEIGNNSPLGEIFLRGEAKLPILDTNNITVTEVRMSQDLKNARAYVIPLGGKDADKIVNLLTEFSYLIRKALSKKIYMKFLPKVSFIRDRSFDYAENIEKLIKESNEKQYDNK